MENKIKSLSLALLALSTSSVFAVTIARFRNVGTFTCAWR